MFNLFPPLRKGEGEPSTVPQDQQASTPRLSGAPRREREERGGDATRSDEVRRLRREVGDLRGLVERQRVEMGKMHRYYQGVVEGETRQARTLGERLTRTEELLAARSAELSEAHTFLSTTDRISEVEVLSIVRDLNENIYQVANHLAEEWEKLEPPATSRIDPDPASQSPVPILVQLARDRDSTGLTYLLQSCLCHQAANMTSSWDRSQELGILESVYKRLSASEGQAISARWRSLTHSHLSLPPPDPASLVKQVASVLDNTGSFSSTQQSLEFVKTVAIEGIESIIQLAVRLELAFMVEVTSSDMHLLFEDPDSVFDGERMIDEFGSDDASTPGKQDKIAGTTEVGVGKIISKGAGKDRRTEILLKTKVVLEKDILGS